ncbi:hypothetical protein C8R44DRAFT_741039 [Mycena epipterygia]|nr:hypothetical protein C8R44DRAFT_741039 [Mycena epipterygia]
MRISLADSDTDPTLSDRPSGGADILSAVMDSFDAVLSQARASRPKPKQATRNEQSDDLLRAILRDIEAAIRPLDPARIASLNLDLQWQAVDTAAEELAISAKALQAFDEETEEKAFVVRQLRILENSVGRLREDLPSDTRPYYYDCEYVFQDPMANIDIVAQLMVLLGLVCNLIMNMSRNSVEFILRVVTMMIKYTMLIPPSKPQKAPDNESYTDMQQHIIDQLPTSFHDAMSKLNLDGKTVLYAACPSCEHVHAPTLSTSKEPTCPQHVRILSSGKRVARPANDAAEKDISAIHHLLVSPLRDSPENDNEDGASVDDADTPTGIPNTVEEGETAETLAIKLAKKRKTALIFVCWTLNLARNPVPPDPRTGEHEATVLTTWMRGANLRRWLKRPNCPKVLQEFNRLFNLYHSSKIENPEARPGIETKPRKKGFQDGEQVYYNFAGMHFSRAETHMGNSLVSYLDEGKIWFGSIEKIKVTPQGSNSLPLGKNDPFKDFPHFPARTYSSKMAETLVDVAPSKVLGHYARFSFSDSCAVVLDLRQCDNRLDTTPRASETFDPHADPCRMQMAQQPSDPPKVSIAWRGFQSLLWRPNLYRSSRARRSNLWTLTRPEGSINSDHSGSRLSRAAYNIYLELLLLSVMPNFDIVFSKYTAPGHQSRLHDGQCTLRAPLEVRATARALSTLITAAQGSRTRRIRSILSFCPGRQAINRGSTMVNASSALLLKCERLPELLGLAIIFDILSPSPWRQAIDRHSTTHSTLSALVLNRERLPERMASILSFCPRRQAVNRGSTMVNALSVFVLNILTLADICRLAPALQIRAHLDTHWADIDLYVREGPGAVYCCGRVPTATLTAFHQAVIIRTAFLDELEVKYGYASDLNDRRRAYSQCDKGDWTHLWFWVFYTDYRVVAERFNHLLFLDDGAPRVLRQCDGCRTEHREFWYFRDVGDFARLRLQGELVLAALGDVNASRVDLEDFGITLLPSLYIPGSPSDFRPFLTVVIYLYTSPHTESTLLSASDSLLQHYHISHAVFFILVRTHLANKLMGTP